MSPKNQTDEPDEDPTGEDSDPDGVSDRDDLVGTTDEEAKAALEEAKDVRKPTTNSEDSESSVFGSLLEDDDVGGFFKSLILLFVVLITSFLVSVGAWLWAIFSDAPSAEGIRDWVSVFWPVLLLILAQERLIRFAGEVFKLLQRKLDHKYPDNMDVHSGHWLEKRLRELGMAYDVEVSGVAEEIFRAVDAYDPNREIVFLSDVTYHKNDPTFWAIAAHELGHALVHRRHKIWSFFGLRSRFVFRQAMAVLPMWLLANTLYGNELGNSLILGLLLVGLGTGLIVVMDEAWASIHALRLMQDDDRIHIETLKDIAILLGSALSTYVAPLLVFIVSLVLWGPVSELFLSAEFVLAEPLAGRPQQLAALVTMILLGFVGWTLWRVGTRKDFKFDLENVFKFENLLVTFSAALLGMSAKVLFFGLVWNLGESDVFMVAAFLFASRFAAELMVVSIPVNIVLGPLMNRVAKALVGTVPDDPTAEPPAENSMKRTKLLNTDGWTRLGRAVMSWGWFAMLPLIAWWWVSLR